MAQDSSRAEFWDTRFRDGVTPWDAGGAPPQLVAWLRGRPPARVLIPGCGSGHEVRLFAQHGAQRMAELVRPGGELAGFFFLDHNPKGPPFGTSRAGLAGLLEGAFELREDRPVPPEQSLPVFQGKEIWQVWKRRL